VTLMTSDHLTPAQKAVSGFSLASAGSYGWPGIYGTGWYNAPAEDLTTSS
jgi:hypothetical protein